MGYTAGRSAHESVEVLNEVGTAVPISLDRDQIFGADVFSQNEIEEIASSPAAQLELLDRFEERDTAAIDRELEHLQRQLDQSSVEPAGPRSKSVRVDDRRVAKARTRNPLQSICVSSRSRGSTRSSDSTGR